MPVNILFIGDIVGKPGRQAVSRELHRLVDRYRVDLVVANGENASGGFGITMESARELFASGIHFFTTGNHVWDKREALEYLNVEDRIIRPANYPEGAPGKGSGIVVTPGGVKVGIVNLEGRIFMNNLDCPFRIADKEIACLAETVKIILVDFHAEATSEKSALGWYLDGRVSAVVGTHTHVQTADERLLASGTAFMTDVGMTGAFDSVIGVRKDEPIKKFLNQLPAKFEVAKKDIRLNGVVITVDETSGKALAIERINVSCD
jgi:metallophosphoesterase (TIGR00282 family)